MLDFSDQRQAVLDKILERKWFKFEPEDKTPYPSSLGLGNEPRWKNLISWARKHCVIRGWMDGAEYGIWALTREGKEWWPKAKSKFKSGDLKASECFLWSDEFKRRMNPDYVVGPQDKHRPPDIYRDVGDAVDEVLLSQLLDF